MKDIILLSLVIIAFAWVVTLHVATVFGLAQRRPRWRALVAFAVFPLAPYWAWREHMRTRAILWTLGLFVYLIALLIASRGA